MDSLQIRILFFYLSPDHEIDHLIQGNFTNFIGAGVFTVPEYGYTVAQFVNFRITVRDVDESDTVSFEPVNQVEEVLSGTILKNICGFIQYQDRWIDRQGCGKSDPFFF